MTAARPSDAPCGPQDTGTGSKVGPEGAGPPQGDTAPHIPAHQQAGYDAVWEIVRRFPGSAERNAVVWRAVEAYRLASEREHERQVRKQVAAEYRAAAQAIEDSDGMNDDPLTDALWAGADKRKLLTVVDMPTNLAALAYRHLADRIAGPEGT